jgi:hypothetical protein
MKSKEEIEQLADFKYQHFINQATQNHFKLGFYDGYTQCQEDMAKKKHTCYHPLPYRLAKSDVNYECTLCGKFI